MDAPPTTVSDRAPKVPVSWLPEHPFHHGHVDLRDEVRVPGVMTSRTEATVRNELGREYACIENIDDQVGLVLGKLKQMGELENTYVIYTADHGIAVGRHGLMGKQNLYEHSWRVPFLASGPGIEPGSRAPGNGYLLDVLPTLCELTGVPVPDTAQGKSLKPVLTGKARKVREVTYGAYCGGSKPGMRSVRKGYWKLIKYDVLEGKVRQTQLFNLKDNPEEILIEHHAPEVVAKTGYQPNEKQVNLADDPKFARKRKRKWKLCCSPKCAGWRIPSVLGSAPGLSPKYQLSGGFAGVVVNPDARFGPDQVEPIRGAVSVEKGKGLCLGPDPSVLRHPKPEPARTIGVSESPAQFQMKEPAALIGPEASHPGLLDPTIRSGREALPGRSLFHGDRSGNFPFDPEGFSDRVLGIARNRYACPGSSGRVEKILRCPG